MNFKNLIYYIRNLIGHYLAKLTKKYYFEDYVRVYPNGIIFSRYGIKKKAAAPDLKNFINHSKFYTFSAQFVKNKLVADIGCGSGYGCRILKEAKAKSVYGADASHQAIKFAQKYFAKHADFSIQSITNLNLYTDQMFDVTISSEVLEHIKEYNKEELAIRELKRITKKNGLIVIGTPNSEMLSDHGFSFSEISKLMRRNFSRFVIFENALLPFGYSKTSWDKRLKKGRVGIIVSEKINLKETLLPAGIIPQIKKGLRSNRYKLGPLLINTSLLHNTHSWVVIAIN